MGARLALLSSLRELFCESVHVCGDVASGGSCPLPRATVVVLNFRFSLDTVI